ncbi:MAG: carboxypeptidase-like regulatory domain-containing protein, partial [Bacteroidales bacterium]
MSFHRFIHICCIFIFLGNAYAPAQTSFLKLSGNITDEDDRPLPLVNISVKGTPYGTVSNDKGEYSLTVPAEREVTLVLTMLGYESVIHVLNGNKGDDLRLDFRMQASFEEISEVMILRGRDRDGSLGEL